MCKKWNTKRIEKEGFIKNLSNDSHMQRSLYKAYDDYLGKKTAITFKTLEYYDMVSYTVARDDDNNIDVDVHIGDTIDVEEDNEMQSHAFAIIRAIFAHVANDKKSMFF